MQEDRVKYNSEFWYGYSILPRITMQAIGSGVERFLDTEEVTGSNPVSPIALNGSYLIIIASLSD